MRSYLGLVPISARIHKRQSRMTRICIILAVFLVTSIFSMVEMFADAQTTEMRRNHGDWHVALQNLSDDEAKQIITTFDVAFFSWYEEINIDADQGYHLDGKNIALYGIEETYTTTIMNYPAEGGYPQNEKEVALSADAKELFGIGVGDNIALNTPKGDFEYTVSGFYEDDTKFNDIIDGACVYMNRAAFQEICKMNGVEPTPQYYIRFQKESDLKKTITNMKQQYNLTVENVKENTGLLGMLGASSNESLKGIYPLLAACFVIVLFSGVFMISSCMNSNVAQRTKFFGMMRCIGASKKQIIRFVRLEALNWCKTAIPIGCILGVVVCWILTLILKFLVKGEWVDMPLFSVSISGILSGAAVGVITVFFAAHSPAKKAAKVSPVVAVAGNVEVSKHVGRAAKTRFLKVETSLGIHHATGAKKNMLLMTGSFSIMIILFLASAAGIDLAHKLLPSVSDFSPDISIVSQDGSNAIDKSLVEEISEISGVESAFGMMLSAGHPAEINGSETTIDLFSYGDDIMMDGAKKSIVSGDLSKVYGDSNYALAIYNQYSHLDVGDKIKIGENEIEIACVASEGVGSISNTATIVCSEETYTRLTGEKNYAMIGVVLGKDISETDVNRILGLAGENLVNDNREETQDVNGSYWVIRLAAYGFLAIISLITVLNIMNSISMGVSARIKQYGAMRAVGMESRQITKMITAEAITYATCGTVVGIILGLILHYLIYVKIIISHFGGIWQIPVKPIAVIVLLVAASCIAAVYVPAKRIRNMAITATINEL